MIEKSIPYNQFSILISAEGWKVSSPLLFTKTGVLGLTKSMAHERSSFHELINAIAPGTISTPIIDGLSSQ